MRAELPIVYACSGCSEAGQLANQVALESDHRGLAEMSCLAGVLDQVAQQQPTFPGEDQ